SIENIKKPWRSMRALRSRMQPYTKRQRSLLFSFSFTETKQLNYLGLFCSECHFGITRWFAARKWLRGLSCSFGFVFYNNLNALIRRQTRPCRDKPPHDYVFLQTSQIVDLARDCRLGEHLGGFLEGRSGDERIRTQRGFRNTQQQRFGHGEGTLYSHTHILNL